MDTREYEKRSEEYGEQIETFKKAIERRNKLEKLLKVPEWKELIEEGFSEEEGQRFLGLLLDASAYDTQSLAGIHNRLDSIRHFKQYLAVIDIDGYSAEQEMERVVKAKADIDEDLKVNRKKYIEAKVAEQKGDE